ncbi:hypothetical protein B0H63DRAFT_561678 [Podospora didyma]|uniref:Zn(2)-C6 fungal-type domain-containing protein n=1 Tax=Podospora didyma TaxID=330526 RepID=A0AAE0NCE4_9PEZI|nr:hypothetical protein B0H63DRAFT_561678 [Podospora didyma]
MAFADQSSSSGGSIMNGLSAARHIACSACRERKVRCDGGLPACERCHQAGDKCFYLPTARPSKADLAQKIETLQQRLEKAEAYIHQMDSGTATGMGLFSDFSPTASGNITPNPIGSDPTFQMSPFGGSGEYHPALAFGTSQQQQIGGFPHHHPALYNQPQQQSTQPRNHSLDVVIPGSGGDFFYSATTATTTNVHDSVRYFHLQNAPMGAVSSETTTSDSPIPSLQEIRKQNSASMAKACATVGTQLSSSSSSKTCTGNDGQVALCPGGQGQTKTACPNCSAIANGFASFASTVFSTQFDIAGISLALAEYLAWMRNNSASKPSSSSSSHDQTNILEALECRAWEVHEMAEARHRAAWTNMMAKLKSLLDPSLAARLAELDEEWFRRSTDSRQFFQGDYDIRLALDSQRANTSAHTNKTPGSREEDPMGSRHENQ